MTSPTSGPTAVRRVTRASSRLWLPLVLMMSTAPLASAQRVYCDASRFNTLTGMWKLEPDQNTRQVTAGELAAERTVMRQVEAMFKSTFVPTGAAGYYGANYDVLPHAVTNTDRYGNTYTFFLSNHKIECVNDKPVAMDVSYGNVSVQVNVHLIGEAEVGDASAGFSFLPRGYYQLADRTALPQPNAEGIHEFTFGDGTVVWWLTRANALPFRVIGRREFLQKQVALVQARRTPSPALLAYYQGLLADASDEVAVVKHGHVASVNESAWAFTSLAEKGNRVFVDVNREYYDRSMPKSAPQHILIRLKRSDTAALDATGNGARHLESIRALRDIVTANLARFRSMVK